MKTVFLTPLFVFSCIFIFGCSSLKPDGEYLRGDWTDFVPKKGVTYYSGNKLEIRFLNDSIFYYHAEQFSDAQREADTCDIYNNEHFAAGRYIAKGNTLYMHAMWTDSYYRLAREISCIDTNMLDVVYTMDAVSDDELELRLRSPLPYKHDWRVRENMKLYRVTK